MPAPVQNPTARLQQALAALRQGDYAQAAQLAAPLHHTFPDQVDPMLLLGLALAGQDRHDQAAVLLARVAALRPDAAHPANDAIALFTAAHRHATIRAFIEASLRHTPADPRLLSAAGAWAQHVGEASRARPLLEQALALRPDFLPAQVALAATLADLGEVETAIAALETLIAAGGATGAALGNLGVMQAVQARFEKAEAAFTRARRQDPAHVQLAINHGFAKLKSGRLAQGWPDMNRRLELPGHSLLPLADLLPPGTDLAGRTVLVTHDSGYGDTLQFARYLPKLVAAGTRVLLWVPRPLHRLLAAIPGIEVFSDNRAWPAYDWHCPIIRLAEVFGTSLATIPAEIPYLHADPALAAAWAAKLPPAPRRIGLVWAGSSRFATPELVAINRRRSLNPALLAPLLELPDIAWISLQLDQPASGLPLHDPMRDVQDFADTAAIIQNLDAVVTVDTAVAHLAGGMGKPVYLLDRYDNCWRWLTGRTDSPWYPTLHIYRQTEWGNWATPIAHLAAALGS